MVFHPFASHYPFETWVSPKKHSSCLDEIDSSGIRDLAEATCETFGKIGRALGQLDFNCVFHLAPAENERRDYLHWYVQIVPRTWTDGGFEMGSGIRINASVPEDTAKFLREE
jgi:UDPglucose--hexose-1-phosphate uridylyltransferase